VNRGNNAGENVLYSGTLGGAMEAALQGVPAIALSQFFGPAMIKLENHFEAAAKHGVATIRNLLDNAIWDQSPYRLFYNVNFPPLPAADVKGIKVAAQGFRKEVKFSVTPQNSPSGRRFLWINGGPQAIDAGEGSDVNANIDGYIAVTPLRADLTAHDQLEDLRGRLE